VASEAPVEYISIPGRPLSTPRTLKPMKDAGRAWVTVAQTVAIFEGSAIVAAASRA